MTRGESIHDMTLLIDIIIAGLVLGGMYALIAHGAHAAVRRRAHHESVLWREPDRRCVRRALCFYTGWR